MDPPATWPGLRAGGLDGKHRSTLLQTGAAPISRCESRTSTRNSVGRLDSGPHVRMLCPNGGPMKRAAWSIVLGIVLGVAAEARAQQGIVLQEVLGSWRGDDTIQFVE